MLIAQLYKDVLEQPAEARQRAKGLIDDKDWKRAPRIELRVLQFNISVLLESGQVEKAIPLIREVRQKDPDGAADVLARAVPQIASRIERLNYDPDPKAEAKLKKFRADYKVFATELYDDVNKAGVPEDQKLGFMQAKAHACEFGTAAEAAESLKLYEQLRAKKPQDSNIVRGIARAHRVLGDKKKAMQWYDRLIAGLAPKTVPWWRAQLERLQFAWEIYQDNAKGLKSIRLQVKILRYKDTGQTAKMGGYWKLFSDLEGQASARLGALGQSTGARQAEPETAPAGASAGGL